MTGKYGQKVDGSFNGTLMEWTSREMQLTRLHEELLARREALLSCSVAYHKSQELRPRRDNHNSEQAFQRNDKLLKDITTTQQRLYEDMTRSPSPRFTTLQKNYWAMVKSQVPLWEQDLGIRKPGVKGQGVGGQGARHKQTDRTSKPKSKKKVHIRR